ncbi:MAG: ABC transporter ATP-binding protein [Candidatus Margulisbacteria bacterium]|nr:ABC transporter ATP-binding protein [Candidatus Margulisiibacteriota bacterium]MBU1617700.1 ABC transporter ATP-binding protein [Candidatus Margulisiibacteriota bacterium]
MLRVNELNVTYRETGAKAVEQVSFELQKGEVLGILGESGSGKSTLGCALLRLIAPPGKIVGGEIWLEGKNILMASEGELRRLRGGKIAMIFQDPFTALDPVFTIGEQIREALKIHQAGVDIEQKIKDALVAVKIDPNRINDYPHQFSGGMRQRVVIAMALACRPEILIADEPTTALDVTIQAEILSLLKEIRRKYNLSIIYITHNFGIIRKICDRVMVMYKGRIVEAGGTEAVFSQPKNEYTKKLVECLKTLTPGPSPRGRGV